VRVLMAALGITLRAENKNSPQCPPPSPRSVEALFAPCLGADIEDNISLGPLGRPQALLTFYDVGRGRVYLDSPIVPGRVILTASCKGAGRQGMALRKER
jgi:hypothetical protein